MEAQQLMANKAWIAHVHDHYLVCLSTCHGMISHGGDVTTIRQGKIYWLWNRKCYWVLRGLLLWTIPHACIYAIIVCCFYYIVFGASMTSRVMGVLVKLESFVKKLSINPLWARKGRGNILCHGDTVPQHQLEQEQLRLSAYFACNYCENKTRQSPIKALFNTTFFKKRTILWLTCISSKKQIRVEVALALFFF